MLQDDSLISADKIMDSLSDEDIKEKICDTIVTRERTSGKTICDNEALRKNAYTYYDSSIESILYFDIRDLNYWLWMHLLVCLFFIGESLILTYFDIYKIFTFLTLSIVFALFIFYFILLISKNKKQAIKLFRNSVLIIATTIFILHFGIVLVDGCDKSIFFPGLLLLASTILGLPRDSGKHPINKINIISFFIVILLIILILSPLYPPFSEKISLFCQKNTNFLLSGLNNTFNQTDLYWTPNRTATPSICISIWILLISSAITIILRTIGSKPIHKNKLE